MTAPNLAGYCAHCGVEIYEGHSALYDDYRDNYFCGGGCFDDWWRDNSELMAADYRRLNVDRVDW